MSNIDCNACQELRETSPEFVQSGVTDKVAASLKNNMGLNPGLTVLHDDCEDLNMVNDCLIGRMTDEVEAYDVCDWKDFMKKFVSNLYETLKGIIAAICGLWIKADLLCDSVDSLFDIVSGGNAKHHPMTPTALFRQKFSAHAGDPARTDITEYLFPDFQCEFRKGAGCNSAKKLFIYKTSIVLTGGAIEPYVEGIRVEGLQVGDVLGYLPMSEVVPDDATERWWKWNLRGAGHHWPFSIDSVNRVIVGLRGYVKVDGVTFNEDLASYGENTMVMYVRAIEENHGTGGVTRMQADTLTSSVVNR